MERRRSESQLTDAPSNMTCPHVMKTLDLVHRSAASLLRNAPASGITEDPEARG